MSETMSRREMLQAAGGITFLAATVGCRRDDQPAAPIGTPTPAAPLLYTAAPYLQPGPASKLVDGQESIVVAWQTEDRPAEFGVEFGPFGSYGQKAAITATVPYLDRKERNPARNYAATLGGLKLGAKYGYRVRQGETLVAEGYFTARKPRGTAVKFVAFGDNSFGDPGQRAVAYHAYKTLPDFVMNTGDNVYDRGLNNEYLRHFFPVYNNDVAHVGVGAPLLRSVPFYTVVANHDCNDARDKKPCCDFDKHPDGGGYFSVMNLPANGPAEPPQAMPIFGEAEPLDAFRAGVGPRYPQQANYSFDFGDCHFLCLDSNIYVDPADRRWADFIDADLGGTDAKWKFVVHHHPAFNVGADHYKEQHMRVHSPLFEKHRVDFVLSGHEHNYQRTRPLRFAPAGVGQAQNINSKIRLVPGKFAIDRKFDGKAATKAVGVIYITTGAGGRHLYDAGFTDRPDLWLRPEDGKVAYVERMVTDRRSFTTFEVDGSQLTMRQIDQWGTEIDALRIVKS